MTMDCRLVVILLAVWTNANAKKAAEFPYPVLTENRTAMVLRLACNPPDDAVVDWDDAHDLRLYASLPLLSRWAENTTIANMTSAMTKPSVNRQVLPEIARVTFNGRWDTKSAELVVVTPLTEELYGTYFCSGEYTRNNRFDRFETKFVVDEAFAFGPSRQQGAGNFKVSISRAHHVKVTWRPPSEFDFTEASLFRTSLDKIDGKDITGPVSLYTTSNTAEFVYNTGVLLARLQHPIKSILNYSIELYVDSKRCHPFCRYTCRVPYRNCVGEDSQFCTCGQVGVNKKTEPTLPVPTVSTSPTASDPGCATEEWPAPVVSILAIILIILIILICFLLIKGKCRVYNPPTQTILSQPASTANQEMTYAFSEDPPTSSKNREGNATTHNSNTLQEAVQNREEAQPNVQTEADPAAPAATQTNQGEPSLPAEEENDHATRAQENAENEPREDNEIIQQENLLLRNENQLSEGFPPTDHDAGHACRRHHSAPR